MRLSVTVLAAFLSSALASPGYQRVTIGIQTSHGEFPLVLLNYTVIIVQRPLRLISHQVKVSVPPSAVKGRTTVGVPRTLCRKPVCIHFPSA